MVIYAAGFSRLCKTNAFLIKFIFVYFFFSFPSYSLLTNPRVSFDNNVFGCSIGIYNSCSAFAKSCKGNWYMKPNGNFSGRLESDNTQAACGVSFVNTINNRETNIQVLFNASDDCVQISNDVLCGVRVCSSMVSCLEHAINACSPNIVSGFFYDEETGNFSYTCIDPNPDNGSGSDGSGSGGSGSDGSGSDGSGSDGSGSDGSGSGGSGSGGSGSGGSGSGGSGSGGSGSGGSGSGGAVIGSGTGEYGGGQVVGDGQVSVQGCDRFVCYGAAVNCYIARLAWEDKCRQIDSLSPSNMALVTEQINGFVRDNPVSKLDKGALDFSGALSKYTDGDGFVVNAPDECPPDLVINTGISWGGIVPPVVKIPLSSFCELFSIVRWFLLAFASVHSLLIISRSF